MQFDQLKRREFITLVGGAVAWPLASRAQQPAKQVVGYLSARSASTDVPMLAALNQGLAEIGFIEGQNVVIELRWGEGQFNRLPALAADLVQQQVAVIVAAGGETVARIAMHATSTIPIVFLGSGDPVQSGLVASINRPGGNITGVNMLLFTLTTKQLGLLRELVPTSKTIALMVNPNQPESELQTSDAQEAARATGQQLVVLKASTEADIDSGFATLVERRADALLVVASPFLMVSAPKIIAYSARHSVPTLYFRREFPEAGGLLSYGTSTAESYRQAGVYAGRILKGAKPGDLPVIQPIKFELVINLKTAKTLGLTIPPGVLAIADEVIE
jgi:putative ABC transport system substrate-binding protein